MRSDGRPATTRYRRAAPVGAVGPSWPRVLGALAVAVALGLVAGLLVPVGGRTGPPGGAGTVLPRLNLPALPWQRRGSFESELVRAVRSQGLLAPSWHRARRTGSWSDGPPVPRSPRDSGPRSALRLALAPDLGPDPLALPIAWAIRRYDRSLRPRGIDPVARLTHVPVIMYHDVVAGAKDVWFDLDTAEFESHLALIERSGVTPVSLKQWWYAMTEGAPLPPKPILLTFDDGYRSVYDLIYPRLKQRGWPAVFFITTSTVGRRTGKDHLTWDQIREMRQTGLFEFQAHSVTHPYLTRISKEQARREIFDCRDTLVRELGEPVQFFCYPIGDRDARIISLLKSAGFVAGFTMTSGGAGQSPNIMEVNRYPCQEMTTAVARADGELRLNAPPMSPVADMEQPVEFHRQTFREGGNRIPVCWVTGGRLTSVHADFRYAVPDVARKLDAVAGINGGFFQLAHVRDISNAMLGPVMATWTARRNEELWSRRGLAEPEQLLAYGRFIPGAEHDVKRLKDRPLVLISPTGMRFVPFDGELMNSRRACELLLPEVTDAFVGGGWLVRDGHPLTKWEMDAVATRDHDDPRRRAFVGIDRSGRPVIGASPSSQSSETIARCLVQFGVEQAALLDSGFSSSLYYNGSLFVTGHSDEQPSRPVPHLLLVLAPETATVQAIGPTVTKVETLLRSADDATESRLMPPNSRLVDQPPEPDDDR